MLKVMVSPVAMLEKFAGGRRNRGALAAQRLRRARLRTVFAHFIEANRTTPMSETEVDQFLDDTTDAALLYSGDSIPRLRRGLHDQALRLSRLHVALTEGWVGPDRQGVIAAGCQEKHAWFDRIAASFDIWFDEANAAESTVPGFCNKGIERFNRLLKAWFIGERVTLGAGRTHWSKSELHE